MKKLLLLTTAFLLTVAAIAQTTVAKYVSDVKYGKQVLSTTGEPPITANNVYVLPAKRSGGIFYTVEVSTDPSFSAGVMSATGTVSADWKFNGLQAGNMYYCRANVNGGPFTSVRTFMVEITGTSKLGKTYDSVYGWQDGASFPYVNQNVYLRPTPVTGAGMYYMEVSIDSSFTDTIYSEYRMGTSWSSIGNYYFELMPYYMYYVRVMTDNEGVFGEVRAFYTMYDSTGFDTLFRPMATTEVLDDEQIAEQFQQDEVAPADKEAAFTTHYAVYPNPFTSHMDIRVDSDKNENVAITVTDLTGKVVYASSNNMTNKVIRIGADLVEGMYLVRIEHGGQTELIRTIKK